MAQTQRHSSTKLNIYKPKAGRTAHEGRWGTSIELSSAKRRSRLDSSSERIRETTMKEKFTDGRGARSMVTLKPRDSLEGVREVVVLEWRCRPSRPATDNRPDRFQDTSIGRCKPTRLITCRSKVSCKRSMTLMCSTLSYYDVNRTGGRQNEREHTPDIFERRHTRRI